MQALNAVIAAVRRELDRASGTVPGRSVLTLNIVLHPAPSPQGVPAVMVLDSSDPPALAAHSHQLRLELTAQGVESTGPLSGAKQIGTDMLAVLSEVFGAPGFDSSARASVFREALEECSDDEARAVIGALSSRDATPGNAGRAAHLIRRVLERGPAGPERGARLLADLLTTTSPQEVQAFIRLTWKTQDDWITLVPADA